ncbi:hypothetical protein EDC39_10132 [Geothermobacter ehrlichii]|uniref:Uncharacterized protein n=1 Tax=Geothermobacter ehrlichii TaxID=213224 RepID=A0A5D3WL95_9BACT|nr:hypothetical protein EDC39_10132 [Geothermobacter ehrlichii]
MSVCFATRERKGAGRVYPGRPLSLGTGEHGDREIVEK